MYFGLKSASPIFQSIMDLIINGIPRAVVYLDDVEVGDSNLGECHKNLDSVLSRFDEFNIQINNDKFHFFKDFIDYRLIVSSFYPNSNKVVAIKYAPILMNAILLKSYLGC